MGFFYLEYTVLALLAVYLARKLTIDETRREKNERSNAAVAGSAVDAIDKTATAQDHDG